MVNLTSLSDIEALRETLEVECKLAIGKDGQGKLPEDFWPTYSAFANTRGGLIILGVRQRATGCSSSKAFGGRTRSALSFLISLKIVKRSARA